MKSDWSIDSDDRKDNQARKKPISHDITSDWETEKEGDKDTIIKAPLRRPNTMPKVLTSGKGKYPLANWTSVIKGQGNNPPKEIKNDRHDISDTPFPRGDPDAKRDSVMMASTNRLQTYPSVLPHHKLRKELANWTGVKLGSPKPKFNSLEEADNYWQRQKY